MVNIMGGQKIEMVLSDPFDVYPKSGDQLADFVKRKKENGRLKVCPRYEEFYNDLATQKAKGQKTPSYHPMERSKSYGFSSQNKSFQSKMHDGQVYNRPSNVYQRNPYWPKPGQQNQKGNQGTGGWLAESTRESTEVAKFRGDQLFRPKIGYHQPMLWLTSRYEIP